MPNCKSCGVVMSEAAAGASIFALSFLPIGGRKINRTRAIRIAKTIGPLCPSCLTHRKDLRQQKGPVDPIIVRFPISHPEGSTDVSTERDF
jgi:hypothetical protein